MKIPDWYSLILLALAAFRTTRIVGWDTILDRPRELVVRKAKHAAGKYRHEVDVWLHCGWCAGFWHSLGWWVAWQIWHTGTIVAAVPLAISAVVGLVTKNLDL